jgi:hypothetical protein
MLLECFHAPSSHGILLCPAASSGFILASVGLVHVSNFRDKRIIGVGVRQQGAYGQQHLKYQDVSKKDSTKIHFY